MHIYRFSDVVQHQRFHGFLTIVKKTLLMFHDPRCNLQQRFVPALQALDEPACFLQVVFQIVVVATGVRASHQRGILRINANPWRNFRIQFLTLD